MDMGYFGDKRGRIQNGKGARIGPATEDPNPANANKPTPLRGRVGILTVRPVGVCALEHIDIAGVRERVRLSMTIAATPTADALTARADFNATV